MGSADHLYIKTATLDWMAGQGIADGARILETRRVPSGWAARSSWSPQATRPCASSWTSLP